MSHVTVESIPRQPSSLRRVLGLNASTSLIAGLMAVVARGATAELLGLDGDRAELVVFLVGIGLVVFAVEVGLTGLRAQESSLARAAGLTSVADIAWVVATVAVLATVDLSRSGQLIGSAMGLGVAAFAALQLRLR